MHMERDSTIMATADPIGRRYRMLGIGLGLSYLLMPTMIFNLRFLSVSLYKSIFHPLSACVKPVGVLSLGFLGASLWRPAGRDWRAVDRAFGIFLATAAAMLVLSPFFYRRPSILLFTETTQRLNLAITLLTVFLLLSSAGLFFTRYSWASVPVSLWALLWLVLLFNPVRPDNPDFLKEREQIARQAPFLHAVDDVFWKSYWATRDPEAVAALFADLPPEARSTLSGFMDEDAVRALLERGDDSAFLQAFGYVRQRGENGAFVPLELVSSAPAQVRVIVSTQYLLFVALAYALTRSLMAIRSATATPTLTEAPPRDQQLQG